MSGAWSALLGPWPWWVTLLAVWGTWECVSWWLQRWNVHVAVTLLAPAYSNWNLSPIMPRWVRNTIDDEHDLRIAPRHLTDVGFTWEPLILRVVVTYTYESKPGHGRLRTVGDTPQPSAVKEYAG